VKLPPPTSSRTLRRWLDAVALDTRAFAVVEGATPKPSKNGQAWDETISVLPHGSRKPVKLLVDSKLRLHPQHALAAVEQAKSYRLDADPNAVPVVAAPYISDRAASICREHALGYFDGAGNCHIAGPGFFVHVEGRPNPTPDTRTADDLFAPKSSRVVRALLEHPHRVWQVQRLAAEMRVSLGLASRVKRKLVQQAFAEVTADGVRAREPATLLEAWAESYRNRAQPVFVYSLDDPATLERRLVGWGAEHSVRCALAEFSAASRLAPMVRYKRAAMYVAESRSHDVIADLLKDLDLKEVDSGASAVLWLTDDDSVFYNSEERDGLSTVSSLQVYLDLRHNPARGEEAAEELLRRTILPRFNPGSTT
jgi:hypothetical protein